MPLTAAPLWVFAALMVVAGAAKVVTPSPTMGAITASGFTVGRRHIQVLGITEVAVGVYTIIGGDVAGATAMLVFYVGFTLFVVNALVRDLPVASCGCFGQEDTPPTWIHVAITLLGAGTGIAALISPPGPVDTIVGFNTDSLMLIALTGVAFFFAYMSLTALPKTLGTASRP